ncbi:MAG TPA: enoyl-CoA hydratase/isomerase family protein [Candidatus Binatia bacterium]|nr:enoyl-CoA hydratase/isomerase family protein [Candidatus Binatia bacterium]
MIRVEIRDGVHVLAFARPPVNAVNVELAEAFHAAVDALVDARACRAVVLTGDRRSFCAGIDNREVPTYDPATRARMLRTINRTIRSLYGLAKPVVAAVSGHAIGAGLVVAITSDFRVVARGAFKLGLTEAAAGIPFPAAPLAICRAELSPRALRVLALGSEAYPPEAPELGEIVDRLVDPDDLLDVAIGEAKRRAEIAAYGRVKLQVRANTIARLHEIVEKDDEPLFDRWT